MFSKILLLHFILIIGYSSTKDAWKLPESIKPEHYDIKILTLIEELKYEGTIEVLVKCFKKSSSITLHSKDLSIKGVKVSVKNDETLGKDILVERITHNKKHSFLIIYVQTALEADKKYLLRIEFERRIGVDPVGFYQSSFRDSNQVVHNIASTHFEPIFARNAFPCFDEPNMKATFKLTMGRLKSYTSLNNMPLNRTEPIEGKEGWYWDHFRKSVRMSTYIVAFAVLDEGMNKISANGINIWVRKDLTPKVNFAKLASSKIMSFYEKYFEIQYELPKMDFLGVPNFVPFAAACENWGLVMFLEGVLRGDDSLLPWENHQVANVISHELAHQWFGNLITMKSFGQLWLKEGFANYLAMLGVDHIFEGQTLSNDLIENVEIVSGDHLSNPLSVNCPGDVESMLFMYQDVAYTKGSLLLQMIKKTVGNTNFKKIMKQLLIRYRFGNFQQSDLWSIIRENGPIGTFPTGISVNAIMNSWTNQDSLCLVEVERNYETGAAVITQQQLIFHPSGSGKSHCWWIPLSYTTKSEVQINKTSPTIWLQCPKKSVIIKGLASKDYLLINFQVPNLFLFKYDMKNWHLLTNTLKDEKLFGKISSMNRFKLVADASQLMKFERIPHEELLNTFLYLKHETCHYPWIAAEKYFTRIYWLNKQIIELMNEYVQLITKSHYTNLKLNIDNDSFDEILFRNFIYVRACQSKLPECLQRFSTEYKIFKNSNPDTNPVIPSRRNDFYHLIAKQGKVEDLNFLLQYREIYSHQIKIKESNGLAFATAILTADIIKKALAINQFSSRTLSMKTFRKSKYFRSSSETKLPFAFILNLPQSFMAMKAKLLLVASEESHEEIELVQFKNFANEHKNDLLIHQKVVGEIIKNIERNIEWKKKYSSEIEIALRKILRIEKEKRTENQRPASNVKKTVENSATSSLIVYFRFYLEIVTAFSVFIFIIP